MCCATKKAPRRLVSSTRFQSSQVTSSAGLRTLQPALLTRMWICGKAFAASAPSPRCCPCRARRARWRTHLRPRASISATKAAQSSLRRAVMMRSAPDFGERAAEILSESAAGSGDESDLAGEIEEWVAHCLTSLAPRGSRTIFIRLGSRECSRSNHDAPCFERSDGGDQRRNLDLAVGDQLDGLRVLAGGGAGALQPDLS